MPPDDVQVPEAVLTDTALLEPDPANPNEEAPEVFSELVESIRLKGFLEPVLAWQPDGSERLRILGGEHRWRAAQYLGLERIPVIVLPVQDEDEAHVWIVRMNAVRGRVNPYKFTEMFNRLRKRHDPDELRRRMGLVNDRAFRQLYKDVRASLPPAVQRRLDATRSELHDVHDLANVVRGALAQYGSTLEHSFAVLEYGGRRHFVIRLSERAFKNLERIAFECLDAGTDINDWLVQVLEAD